MGQILRAIQDPMGREVAIKIMKAPQEQDAEKRFFREAAITSKLQHPNTVRIYDYGKEGEGSGVKLDGPLVATNDGKKLVNISSSQ